MAILAEAESFWAEGQKQITGPSPFDFYAGIEHPVSRIHHQDGNRPILTFCDRSGYPRAPSAWPMDSVKTANSVRGCGMQDAGSRVRNPICLSLFPASHILQPSIIMQAALTKNLSPNPK
jgi:hypothetical protein